MALKTRKQSPKRQNLKVTMDEDRLTTTELARDIAPQGEAWLDLPNVNIGLRKPRDLLGTAEEVRVRHMLLAAKYGIFG